MLKPGGPFLFNAWDSLAHNDFAAAVWDAIVACYPENPPDFFPRLPHGYFGAGPIVGKIQALVVEARA